MKIFYSPNKHGRRVNDTNTIRTTQLQSRQKHLKLDSNLFSSNKNRIICRNFRVAASCHALVRNLQSSCLHDASEYT